MIAGFVLFGCGGERRDQAAGDTGTTDATAMASVEVCALLTSPEIQTALSWTPDSTAGQSYGTTGSCTFFGPNTMQQVSLLVGQGMPDMSSSAAMATWRSEQYTEYKVTDAIVKSLDGLGVPAIQNEYGGLMTIEMAVGSQLVSVSSLATVEQMRSIASVVLGRLR